MPGNVYGESRHPVDIERNIRKKKDWSKIVGERSSLPRRQKAAEVPEPIAPGTPEEKSSDSEGSASKEEKAPSDSEDEVQDPLEPSDDEEEEANLAKICQEGGVAAIIFLMSKAVSPAAEDTPKNPKEWAYCNIARLPLEECKAWRSTCKDELDAL